MPEDNLKETFPYLYIALECYNIEKRLPKEGSPSKLWVKSAKGASSFEFLVCYYLNFYILYNSGVFDTCICHLTFWTYDKKDMLPAYCKS